MPEEWRVRDGAAGKQSVLFAQRPRRARLETETVQWRVSVMRLQRKRRQGCGHYGTHRPAMRPLGHPTAVLVLGRYKFLSHGLQPAPPGGALLLIGCQSAVIGIIEVIAVQPLLVDDARSLGRQFAAVGKPQQLSAEKPDSIHRRRSPLRAGFVRVAKRPAMFTRTDVIQKAPRSIQGRSRHLQAGHLRAGQNHDDPTGHRQISLVLRFITPTALLVLGFHNEIHSRLSTRPQSNILGNAVGLNHGQTGNAMIIHVALRVGPAQITIGLVLLINEPIDALLNCSAVGTIDIMPFPAPVKHQQSRTGGGHIMLALAAVFAEIPAAIFRLSACQKCQRLVYGCFRGFRATELGHHVGVCQSALA